MIFQYQYSAHSVARKIILFIWAGLENLYPDPDIPPRAERREWRKLADLLCSRSGPALGGCATLTRPVSEVQQMPVRVVEGGCQL